MPSVTPDPGSLGGRQRLWRRALRLVAVAASALLPVTAAVGQDPVIPPPQRTDSASTPRPVGGLRPGDLLKVAVYKDAALSGEYLIDNRGMVQIPGLGIIRVSGMDPTNARDSIVKAMQKNLGVVQPEIAVQALVRVTVLGAVRNPALYPVEPGTNLVQMLAVAGGPVERADLRKTRVVRDGREFVVDLESGLAGSAAGRILLYSNDIVNVPARTGFTRENAQFLVSLLSAALTVVTLVTTLRRD